MVAIGNNHMIKFTKLHMRLVRVIIMFAKLLDVTLYSICYRIFFWLASSGIKSVFVSLNYSSKLSCHLTLTYLLRSVKAALKCIICDMEVCENIAIVRESIVIVHGD